MPVNKKKTILVILLVAVSSSVSTAFAVGGTNIIFKTFDGITSHEVMRITSDQKVGIGTSTPTQTLDVAGNEHLSGNMLLSGKINCIGCVNSTDLSPGVSGSTGPTGPAGSVPAQQCSVGKIVVGFGSNGNSICKSINFVPDLITTPDTVGNVGVYASIAIGTDTFPVISYWDGTNADLKIVHCTSISCSTFDTPLPLDSVGIVGLWTSIAIGTDTFPVISYWDDANGDLKIVHCTSISCGTHDTPATLDSTGVVGEYTSIAIGTDGFPAISYYDNTNGDLKIVHCTSISCSTFDTPLTLDSVGNVGFYTSIAIGTDTFPVISYDDRTNFDLKIVHCTSISCSTHDTPTTLDSTGADVGQFSSIAIGTDTFPVISYDDAANGDLKLVHCINVSCSTHDTPLALDTPGDVGQSTSIKIGTDTFPVISYRDTTNGDLKIVHCTSVSCSTHDTPLALDTGGVGEGTSIAIGTDGFPVISYKDDINVDLKVIRKGGAVLS